jgi:hypothetical protein
VFRRVAVGTDAVSLRPVDELLREFLEGKPNDAVKAVAEKLQEIEKHFREWTETHEKKDDDRHNFVIAAIGGHDARLKRVEAFKASIVPEAAQPTLHELGKAVTDSGHWDVSKLDELLARKEAQAALERQKAVGRAAGKVSIALLVLLIAFAVGSFWRDLWGPRPGNTTITNVAPQPQGK